MAEKQFGGGGSIPGALEEGDVGAPVSGAITTGAAQFTGNIIQSFTVTTGLTDSVLVVGVGLEVTGSNEMDSVFTSITFAGQPMNTLISAAGNDGANHVRAALFELPSPPEGTNNLLATFMNEPNIRDGTLAFFLLPDTHQFGADAVAQNYSGSSEALTNNFTTQYDDSLVIDMGSHGQQSAGPWVPQNAQTVVFNSDGDAGQTANQDACAGYRSIATAGSYSSTWDHGPPVARCALVSAVYSAPHPLAPSLRVVGRGFNRGFRRGFDR